MRTGLAVLALILLVPLAGCGTGPTGAIREATTPQSVDATVVEVIDGDTIDVRYPDGETDRVRLLGVDTPEVHAATDPAEFEGVPDTAAGEACLERAGRTASQYLTERINGSEITLRFDALADRRGSYGRLLAYVVHGGTNLNAALVATGHARVYDSAFQAAPRFYAAESRARRNRSGLWRCVSVGS
ncbi:MAG: thermonuclease family protein [Halodesulfurarchaeum sp.]